MTRPVVNNSLHQTREKVKGRMDEVQKMLAGYTADQVRAMMTDAALYRAGQSLGPTPVVRTRILCEELKTDIAAKKLTKEQMAKNWPHGTAPDTQYIPKILDKVSPKIDNLHCFGDMVGKELVWRLKKGN